jgi:hypothetical protein
MPAGVFVNEGLARGLKWLLSNPDTALVPWELLLFVNDLEPDEGTVLANLTEPTWGAYARVTIDPAEWTAPFLMDNEVTSDWGTEPVEFFNVGGPTETPFGFAFFDPGNGALVYAERFDDGDITAVADGESKFILPRVTRRSLPA